MDDLPAPESERRFPHLTAMQEAFAVNYAINGGKGREAAVEAGFSQTSAHVLASRMLRNPAIAQAILECTALQLVSFAPGAAARINRLSESAKSEYVQLEASKDILDRIGASAPKRVAVSGAVSITIDLGE